MSRPMFNLPPGGEPTSIVRLFSTVRADEENFNKQLTSGSFVMSPAGAFLTDGYTMREQLLLLGLMCDQLALTDTVSDREEPLRYSKAVRALINKPMNIPLTIPNEITIPGRLLLGRRGLSLLNPDAFFKADDIGLTIEDGASKGTELILLKGIEGSTVSPVDGIPVIRKDTIKKLMKIVEQVKDVVGNKTYNDVVGLLNLIDFGDFEQSVKTYRIRVRSVMAPVYEFVSTQGDGFISINPLSDTKDYIPISTLLSFLTSKNDVRRNEARIIVFVLLTGFSDDARTEDGFRNFPIHYHLLVDNEENYLPIEKLVYGRLDRIFASMPQTFVTDANGPLFRVMNYNAIADPQTSGEVYKIQRALYTGDLFVASLDRVFSATEDLHIDIAIGQSNKDLSNPLSSSAGDGIFTQKKDGDDERVTQFYLKKTVSIELALLAAYGNPKTYADILHYYQNTPAEVKNRTTQLCSRFDALLQVGIDPNLIIQTSWDPPGEVANKIVEQRIRMSEPLSYADLRKILDEVTVRKS